MLWLDVRGLVQIDACPAGVWVRLAFTSPVAVTGSTSYVVSIDNLDQYTATGDDHYQTVHLSLTMRAGARREPVCVCMARRYEEMACAGLDSSWHTCSCADGGFVYANPSSGILTLSADTAGASGDSNGGFPYTTSSTNYW